MFSRLPDEIVHIHVYCALLVIHITHSCFVSSVVHRGREFGR